MLGFKSIVDSRNLFTVTHLVSYAGDCELLPAVWPSAEKTLPQTIGERREGKKSVRGLLTGGVAHIDQAPT